ncbi:lipopolysaccharide biosynthesis protein [Streptomyces sp. NPDC008313]|uniref:lipopolysaccharide biosynthesis protein n=1 Tax=Streptomyces sp. NPDC008313 TaxID=3364826 RepID=UPI0036DFE449
MTDNPTGQRRPTGGAVGRVLARAKTVPPWSLLATGALLGGLAGGAYGVLTPPVYTATSYVIAVPTAKADPAAALGFAQAYGRVATQLAVLGDAQVWAGVPVRTLRESVTTATSPDAPMVAVSATSSRPDLARDIANAVTRSLTRHAGDSKDSTHVELVQFSRAVAPGTPSSASPTVTGLVGVASGGLLGGLVLLVRPRRAADQPSPTASVPSPAAAADAHGQL